MFYRSYIPVVYVGGITKKLQALWFLEQLLDFPEVETDPYGSNPQARAE